MHGVSLKTVEKAIAKGKIPVGIIARLIGAKTAISAGDLLKEMDGAVFVRPAPREHPPKEPLRTGFVYFIKVADTVKIGFSGNPDDRIEVLKTMNSGAPRLLYKVRGSVELERKFHIRFSEYRVRGEWFRLDGYLKEWLASKVASKSEAE